MDDINFEEALKSIKSLSALITLKGIASRDPRLICLGNAMGITAASLDLGPEFMIELTNTLAPLGHKIKAEIDKGNLPGADVVMSFKGDELLKDPTGILNKIKNKMETAATDEYLKDVLDGTGVNPSDKE